MKRNSYRLQFVIVLLFLASVLSSSFSRAQAYRFSDNTTEKKKPVLVKTNPAAKDSTEKTPVEKTPNDVSTPIQEIKNVKIISEEDDGKGNFVRTIQYNKGSMRITETIIKPKTVTAVMGLRVNINPDTMDKKLVQIIVDKTEYSLKVLYRKKPIRVYKATFGPQPKQDKCMEGDRCTPEGSFTINHLNPRSMYNKFMQLNYPNESSWEKFNSLKKNGKIPSSAKIGGSIGIHGIWKGGDQLIDLGVGWTDGCVALKNNDVDDLYKFVGVGTKVIIKQ